MIRPGWKTVWALAIVVAAAGAGSPVAEQKKVLVELYTSQG
jgi:hypothetical protein